VPQKARAVEAALKSKGFRDAPKRDHTYYFLHYKGKKTNIFTKISHGAKEIGDPNCSLMAKQMRLTNPQFKDFVECPLGPEDYVKLLIAAKQIEV